VILLLWTLLLTQSGVWAAPSSNSIISEIEVRGLKRIEKEAILNKIKSKVNQASTADRAREDIQSIFSLGYFDDIEVLEESTVSGKVKIIYVVKERPAVSKIEFDGNENISSSDLKDVIKIKEWSILDMNKVKESAGLIQKHFEEKGYYLAKVNFEIRTESKDEVAVIYKINDYDKIQIKKITFLNNKHFTDDQLKSVFRETKEGGFFSFLSGSGNFKESSFKQDLQMLTLWYYDHGYIKFRFENPSVTVSDDKKWLFVSIYVDEGEPYKIGTTDFSGDLLYTKEELSENLLMKDDYFSVTKRNYDIQTLTEKYQDLGYAFVNVIPKMNLREEEKVVDIEYSFEKGNLVYFNQINVTGNTKTYDKVIRRELKVHEGELFSGSKLRQSRENVERLGFFQPGEVIFNTVTIKGRNDLVDIEISVKERSTGTITLGAGFSSANGFFFTTQVSEINLFGKGQNISLAAQYAANSINKSFTLGFTDPYAFDTKWSLGFDLFSTNFQYINKYITTKLGFDLRAGYPIAEYIYAYLTYKNEGLRIMGIDGISYDQADLDDIANDTGVLSSVIFSVVRDKRNNRYETTEGNFQSASFEFAGLGGDKNFLKIILNNRFYKHVVGNLVFRNNIELGNITSLGSRPLPPSEKFYLGGPNNMKGYDFNLLGPVRFRNNGTVVAKGGAVEMFGLFELEHPLVKDAGLKFVVFYDIGNTWETFPGTPTEAFTLRQDVGFGIRWFSPIGPLRFEWGYPINPKSYEQNPVFIFFIGPPF
jgi:outer membrane protein insertion porin family